MTATPASASDTGEAPPGPSEPSTNTATLAAKAPAKANQT